MFRFRTISSLLLIAPLLLLPTSDLEAQSCTDGPILAGPLRYDVVASAPRVNRRPTGEITHWVQGVPAEPVDSFVYDGVGSVNTNGFVRLVADPVAETGIVEAEWEDEHGSWSYSQSLFVHPEHLSGVRLGASINLLDFRINEGVSHNVHLHGDSGAGMPVLPTVFTYLATWGPAEVRLNGELFENIFEFPAPLWVGHVMVTEGAREPDGSVRNSSGGIYSPGQPANGSADYNDLELHLVFHDERFPDTTNHPKIFSFFYHLIFEDVSISISENSAPIIDPNQPQLGTAPSRARPPGVRR
jgi:hypothetical protein